MPGTGSTLRATAPIAVLLCLLAPGPATAQPTAPGPAAEIRAAEDTLRAAIHARDAAALEQLLAPGYVLRGAPDVDRATWIRNGVTLCWGDRSDIGDFNATVTGDTAVATFQLTFHVDPATCTPALLRSLITDVWTRTPAGWQLLVRHSGPVPSGGLAAQYGAVPLPPARWEATAELSAVATAGNTSTQTLGVAGDVTHRRARHLTRGSARFLTTTVEEVTQARALTAQARHGYAVRERVELFGRAEYARDRFAGIDSRNSVEFGAAYRPDLRRRHVITASAAAGFTAENRIGADDLRFATANGTAGYIWTPRPGTELREEAAVIADLQTARNWRATNGLSFVVTLTRLLSLKASHGLEYRNLPVPGFRRTDTRSSAALVLTFERRPAPGP